MSIPDNFLSKKCIYLFSKHIGQHLFSLLTLFNVPIDEVCQKFGKMHEIFENWKLLVFLSFPVSIWDIFNQNIAIISSLNIKDYGTYQFFHFWPFKTFQSTKSVKL